MPDLRQLALEALTECDPLNKCRLVQHMDLNGALDPQPQLQPIGSIPGRPARPELVPPSQLQQRKLNTAEGRAVMIHALAHIEFNAINLALDIVWRFAGRPEAFYRDWLKVAQEEALHFQLLRDHLLTLGHDYGDFPAHNGLWLAAERTRHDLLARLALVPRTLEARGLDVTPGIHKKLVQAGDTAAAGILDIILRDEIGHVASGNHWYNWLCRQSNVLPQQRYRELAAEYAMPLPKGPFNQSAREQAGFDAAELASWQPRAS